MRNKKYTTVCERRAAAAAAARRYRERHREDETYLARRREQQRAYYRRNGDAVRARARERNAKHRVSISAHNRNYYLAHREELQRKNRALYVRNLAKRLESQRQRNHKRYAEDPAAWLAYQKRWRRRYPERARGYVRISAHKRRSAQRGHFTIAQWEALLAVHRGLCAYCGASGKLAMEHRIPISRGGDNSIENILPSCKRCNSRKHTKTENEFRLLLAREAIVTALTGSALAVGRSERVG